MTSQISRIARAFETDENGDQFFLADLSVMRETMQRLSLWERGLVASQLLRAAAAKRPNKDQRALLALFAHRAEEDQQ